MPSSMFIIVSDFRIEWQFFRYFWPMLSIIQSCERALMITPYDIQRTTLPNYILLCGFWSPIVSKMLKRIGSAKDFKRE